MFKYPLKDFTKFSEMNETCSSCGAPFTPEPGFYFGAMYVSYAFTIAIFFAVWFVLRLFFNPQDWVYITCIILSAVLIIPISFRYSRILFLYWFGGLRSLD